MMLLHKTINKMMFWMFLTLIFCAASSGGEKEPFGTGGFTVMEKDGGDWYAGAPACFGGGLEDNLKDATIKDGDKDHLVLTLNEVKFPWKFTVDKELTDMDIPLKPLIDGSTVSIEVKGMGILAADPNLNLYNDQTGLDQITSSFLSGSAVDSIPEKGKFRIVGVSTAVGWGKIVTDEEKHPLKDVIKAKMIFSAIEYIPESKVSTTIKTADDLKKAGVKTITFIGFDCELKDNKSQVVECHWVGNTQGEYYQAKTSPIGDLGGEVGLDIDIETSSLNTPTNGSLQKITIPARTINNIIDIGLDKDLVAMRVGAPGGNMIVADLPGFTVPVPGIAEGLKFSDSRISLTLGSSHNGSQFGFSIDAGLDNPGALLGPLGSGISGPKRVTLTVEGKTLIVNFRNSLEDLKPLGFSLMDPTVAVDLDKKSLLLSGSIKMPDTFPTKMGDTVDVVCDLSKTNLQFLVISAVEVPIFDDKIRLGLSTLSIGMTDGELYFNAMGKAYIVEDISLLQGIDVFKKMGLDLTVGASIEASLFAQSDGTFHVELITKDLIGLDIGPVQTNLDEISFVLDHTPGSPWVASIAGQTSLDLNAGIFKLHATTRAELSTDGTLKIEVPNDPENPTRIEIGDLSVALTSGSIIIAKNAEGQYEVALDAVATTMFPKAIPLIGGQNLTGHMAAKSDGTFLFEVTEIPQLEFLDMKVGLATLKVENKKENNTFLLSFEAGAGVEFLPSFPLPPLRNEKLTGSLIVSSDLTVMFKLTGLVVNLGDFRFGIDELKVGIEKGRDLAVGGTAVLEVKYPSSKYFGIGLPAALAGKETGPTFDIRGSVAISATNVYFTAQSDSMEFPIDIPSVIEGVTLRVEKIGAGITYNGVPLFDLKGGLYLPDFDGGGKTGITPTLERPYDSRLGLALAANVQDGIVLRVDTEGSPKIAIKPVFEFGLDEAGVSTWLYGYALSADLSTRLKIGAPEKGFGTLFDLKEGHLTFIQIVPTPMMIPVPFYDSCRIETNAGGFGMAMESEFPRPDLVDIGMIMDAVGYIQKGQVNEIFNQCGRGGKFNTLFPKFAVREANLFMPKQAAKVLNAPDKLDLLAKVGGQIDLDSGDIVPLLPPFIKAVSNPKDTLAGIVSTIPEKNREGYLPIKIGVSNFNLLSGHLHYRLQAREQVFVNRTIPRLSSLLASIDTINAAEKMPGEFSFQHWKLVDTDGGYIRLQNRLSNLYMTLGNEKNTDNGAGLVQSRLDEESLAMQWAENNDSGNIYSIHNRLAGKGLAYSDDNACVWDSARGDRIKWNLAPVYGTPYVRLYNSAADKVVSVKGGSKRAGAEVVLDGKPTKETVNANGTPVTIVSGMIELKPEITKTKSFVDGLKLGANSKPSELMAKVRSSAGGRKLTGSDSEGYDVQLTDHTSVTVSPYGYVSASIGNGALEIRTKVANAPEAGVVGTLKKLELDTVASMGIMPVDKITTTREVAMGNPDCHAARTWKKLWQMRDASARPIVKGTKIQLMLKNGTIAGIDITANCRIVMDVMKQRYTTIMGRKYDLGSYTVKVREWRKANIVKINNAGQIMVAYNGGGIASPDLLLFDPSKTDSEGNTGIQKITLSLNTMGIAPTGGFESKKLDPEFTFSFADDINWKATLTGTGTLSVESPKSGKTEIELVSGISGTLDMLLSNSSSNREYGDSGQMRWYLAKPGAGSDSGKSGAVDEIVAKTGEKINTMTMSWSQGGKANVASINDTGALIGLGGLKGDEGSTSYYDVTSGGVTHKVVVGRLPIQDTDKKMTPESLRESASKITTPSAPYGPYHTSVMLEHGGNFQLVDIVNAKRGIVRDPAFREIPMGLDVDGSMQIGDKLLIQTALAFAGHIDEAGGVALAANGHIVVQGFELGSSSFSFRHYPDGRDNGLTFSGQLKAPFQGTLKGEIHENGNFHVAGAVKLLLPGVPTTGFIGDLVLDPKESWLHGAIYVAGSRVLWTHTKITRSSSQLNVNSGSEFNIGMGGYYKRWWFFGWHKSWIPYSGAKGGLNTAITFQYKKPSSITADVGVYLQGWILDKSLGRFQRNIHVPNLREVRTMRVLGRNLDWRVIPLYLKWDAPFPLWDPQIGSR
ncbi:MAG: RICIN domain-containing protein [Planctomycetes bacterium]|nr:RICIN domain-containing protein [Planctomycetota bacterium]